MGDKRATSLLNLMMKLCVAATIAALFPAGPEVVKQQKRIWVLVGVNFAYGAILGCQN